MNWRDKQPTPDAPRIKPGVRIVVPPAPRIADRRQQNDRNQADPDQAAFTPAAKKAGTPASGDSSDR